MGEVTKMSNKQDFQDFMYLKKDEMEEVRKQKNKKEGKNIILIVEDVIDKLGKHQMTDKMLINVLRDTKKKHDSFSTKDVYYVNLLPKKGDRLPNPKMNNKITILRHLLEIKTVNIENKNSNYVKDIVLGKNQTLEMRKADLIYIFSPREYKKTTNPQKRDKRIRFAVSRGFTKYLKLLYTAGIISKCGDSKEILLGFRDEERKRYSGKKRDIAVVKQIVHEKFKDFRGYYPFHRIF